MDILQIDNLSFRYPDMEEMTLKKLHFTVKEGDFVVLAGASGSGKTTLLRLLKRELAPFGEKTGTIYFNGQKLEQWDDPTMVTNIGFVFQDPENQIIMDYVLQEITFGMEHVNIPPLEMKKRLAELVHFFGLEQLLHEKTTHLSGGQKQLINLLSVLLLRPKVLLLDEPTSQLDPVAAKELLQILERLNDELGITIIIIEHRLEELFAMADQLLFLHDGEIVYNGACRDVIAQIAQNADERFGAYLPSVSQLFLQKQRPIIAENIPLSVKDARRWLSSLSLEMPTEHSQPEQQFEGETLLEVNQLHFQYEKDAASILKNCSLSIKKGEFFGLVGGNGSGKTTLLQLCMGMHKQQKGKIMWMNKKLKSYKMDQLVSHFAYLPQHPLAFYIEDTIGKEMNQIIHSRQIADGEAKKQTICDKLQVSDLLDRHPNDLSGGELQRATIACLLLHTPTILCIDEPTKGLDPLSKKQLADLLTSLQAEGLTIFMVTHDIEFAVQYVDRCAMLFDKHIVAEGSPEQLFKGNYFYTTTMNRATVGSPLGERLTLEEMLQVWSKTKITI